MGDQMGGWSNDRVGVADGPRVSAVSAGVGPAR